MEFILKDGWNYEEKGPRDNIATDFTRLGFKEYKKLFDLSSFQLSKTSDSNGWYDPKILTIRQLNTAIDSLKNTDAYYLQRDKMMINPYIPFAKYMDTGWKKIKTDSLKKVKSFAALIPDSIKNDVYQRSVNVINSTKSNILLESEDYLRKRESLQQHEIEWHRKFTLSVACLVLFIIGAPLGAIIRKGGLGMPLIFAIAFFVLFYLLNTFGEKFAKQNVVSAFSGMWLSTAVLIPIGFFLTYKAMRDSQLFNKEFYYRFFKKVRTFLSTFRLFNSSN